MRQREVPRPRPRIAEGRVRRNAMTAVVYLEEMVETVLLLVLWDGWLIVPVTSRAVSDCPPPAAFINTVTIPYGLCDLARDFPTDKRLR